MMDLDGVYMDPGWLFVDDIDFDEVDPELSDALQEFGRNRGTQVAVDAAVDGRRILVTHWSGVFVEATSVVGRPGYGMDERQHDRRDAARVVNLLMCELGLAGVVARLVTVEDLCAAKEDGDRAVIWAATGIKQVRSWAAQGVLDGPESLTAVHWPMAKVDTLRTTIGCLPRLEAGCGQPCTSGFRRLRIVRAQLGATGGNGAFRVDGDEQLVSAAWSAHCTSGARDTRHRKRLRDFRTYTAAVQIDTLQGIGRIEGAVADALHVARAHRITSPIAHS
jgi:hypothetical protein